jgi:predicted secreted hydrolase
LVIPRRALLAAGATAALAPRAAWPATTLATAPVAAAGEVTVVAPRALAFPRDFGAHLPFGIEWWYATGWLAARADGAPAFGFQITFFRSRTGQARELDSRFAGRQLLLAHAALTDLGSHRLRHAERVARWSEDPQAPPAAASVTDTRVHIGDWRLEREAVANAAPSARSTYRAAVADRASGFGLRLRLAATQPLLLQGDAGFSRKGPEPRHASHYYSQPQLAVDGTLQLDGREQPLHGRAWLDHEWSQSLMPEGAVGWDWIGINLDDGGALTAFRLRDREGRALWAGGSHRAPGGAVRAFGADEVGFEALAWWTSAATRARYGVRWRVTTPVGRFEVRALQDDQELDARASTGTVYWEGLSGLHDAAGARRGLGYLEMTGYADPLKL